MLPEQIDREITGLEHELAIIDGDARASDTAFQSNLDAIDERCTEWQAEIDRLNALIDREQIRKETMISNRADPATAKASLRARMKGHKAEKFAVLLAEFKKAGGNIEELSSLKKE